jgi:hypothetical protein
MENCKFTDDFPIKTSIYNAFSTAMLNYQRVFGANTKTTFPKKSINQSGPTKKHGQPGSLIQQKTCVDS